MTRDEPRLCGSTCTNYYNAAVCTFFSLCVAMQQVFSRFPPGTDDCRMSSFISVGNLHYPAVHRPPTWIGPGWLWLYRAFPFPRPVFMPTRLECSSLTQLIIFHLKWKRVCRVNFKTKSTEMEEIWTQLSSLKWTQSADCGNSIERNHTGHNLINSVVIEPIKTTCFQNTIIMSI